MLNILWDKTRFIQYITNLKPLKTYFKDKLKSMSKNNKLHKELCHLNEYWRYLFM